MGANSSGISKQSPATPLFYMGWPQWWHPHGKKFVLDFDEPCRIYNVVLRSPAAKVAIGHEPEISRWQVTWSIVHWPEGSVRGHMIVNTHVLEAMFGLCEYVEPGSESLIEMYGGSSAAKGIFLRYERWLNIPGPGTGGDGDPNVSVFVTDEMKDAVRGAIKGYRLPWAGL